MPLSGQPPSRGHLRLASAPVGRLRGDGRSLLRLRSIAAALAIALATLAMWLTTAVALVPVLWRRDPVGRRLRAQAPREARVIPFQPRRTALPR